MGSSRGWKEITLPNGKTIQTTQLKRSELYTALGIDVTTEIQQLEGEDAAKLMIQVERLWPDQMEESS